MQSAQANSNGAKNSPRFDMSAHEAPALQDSGWIFFFAAFIVQLTATNFCITHSHLHFSTIHFKFCICIHFMNFRTNKMQAELCDLLYCWSFSFTCPLTPSTVITKLFLSLLSSDLVFSFCKVLQCCQHCSLLIINFEELTCFQYWDMKWKGNFNNKGTCDSWSKKRRRFVRNQKFLYVQIYLLVAAQRQKECMRDHMVKQ